MVHHLKQLLKHPIQPTPKPTTPCIPLHPAQPDCVRHGGVQPGHHLRGHVRGHQAAPVLRRPRHRRELLHLRLVSLGRFLLTEGGAIKGKSQKIKKAKTGGGSPPYLGPITLNKWSWFYACQHTKKWSIVLNCVKVKCQCQGFFQDRPWVI